MCIIFVKKMCARHLIVGTELSNTRYDFQIMRLFVQTRHGSSILEQNHGRRLLVGIPQLGNLGIILLFDGNECSAVRQELFGAENVIFNSVLGVGIIEVDEHGLVFGKQGKDFFHGVVLGVQGGV